MWFTTTTNRFGKGLNWLIFCTTKIHFKLHGTCQDFRNIQRLSSRIKRQEHKGNRGAFRDLFSRPPELLIQNMKKYEVIQVLKTDQFQNQCRRSFYKRIPGGLENEMKTWKLKQLENDFHEPRIRNKSIAGHTVKGNSTIHIIQIKIIWNESNVMHPGGP